MRKSYSFEVYILVIKILLINFSNALFGLKY